LLIRRFTEFFSNSAKRLSHHDRPTRVHQCTLKRARTDLRLRAKDLDGQGPVWREDGGRSVLRQFYRDDTLVACLTKRVTRGLGGYLLRNWAPGSRSAGGGGRPRAHAVKEWAPASVAIAGALQCARSRSDTCHTPYRPGPRSRALLACRGDLRIRWRPTNHDP